MKVAIVSGSVYGSAEMLAEQAKKQLEAAGFTALHDPNIELETLLEFAPGALLVITSTTGMGELPSNLQVLYCQLQDRFPDWRGLPAAVLALGDSSYEIFCGAGEQMRELLLELGVRELQPMLRWDGSESVTPDEDAQPWLVAFIEALRAL